MTADPLRLLQDPATAAVLRRDLGAAARGVPYDVGAGLARFEASLSQGPGTAVTSARFGGASGPLAVGGLLLIGGLAAALGWALAAPEPTPAEFGGREVAAAPVISSPLPTPTPLVPDVVPALPQAQPEPPADVIAVAQPNSRPTKARRPKGVRNEVSVVKDKGPADYLREARSLNTARAQLGQDAAQALALAEAGIAEFKDGTFAQEWEGIAVLALFELGKRDAARMRAESFLQRYPSGTYAPRIRQARDEAQP
jgi:hypothetical protein